LKDKHSFNLFEDKNGENKRTEPHVIV